jgi:copper transport protein
VRRFVFRLALALFVGTLATLAAPAAPASAHAYLAGSAPADGAILDRAPEALVFSFTEHVELSGTHIDIVDGDGRHWTVTSVVVRPHQDALSTSGPAPVVADTGAPVDVVAGLPHLPANTYHVAWRTLSSDDLHQTTGTLVIGVQRQVTGAGAPAGPGGPGLRESVLRGFGLIGLCTLVGGAALAMVLGMLARRRTPEWHPDEPVLRGRLLRVAGWGGAVALLAVPAQLLLQASAGSSAFLAAQAGSGRWLIREIGPAMLVAAVLWARRGVRPGWLPPVLTLGALGAVLAAAGTALLGHPGAGALAGTVHVLAAGGWAGSVLVAAVALVPALGSNPVQVRLVLRAFAVLAAGCLAVLTVTGLLMTGALVATVDALLTTPYGLLLLAKVAAVGVAGLLGLRTFRRLRRIEPALPRRGLVAEAVALVAVLALAGSLAAAGPARGPRFPTGGRVVTQPEVSGQAADLVDTVQIRPNRPGRNVVTVTVADTRRPAPAPVTGVSVLLTGPDGTRRVHPVTRTTEGWVVTVDDIRAAGDWRVSVTIMRDGLAPVTDAHAWAVAPAATSAVPVFLSSAPLEPIIGWLAWLLAFAIAAATVLLAHRRGLLSRAAFSRSPFSRTALSRGSLSRGPLFRNVRPHSGSRDPDNDKVGAHSE